MKALILGCQEVSGTTNDVKRIARKLLNKTTKDKVISKQECMCHLAKLDLVLCSESIETVSISGEYHLCTDGESKSTFLPKYAKRENTRWNDMSLHQYFHMTKNSLLSRLSSSQKYMILHYVGA
jgi:hypothetical protein